MCFDMRVEMNDMFAGNFRKRELQQKLNELFDRYGESRRAVENGISMTEWMDFVLASDYADEVLAKRRAARGDSCLKPGESSPYARLK